MASGVTGSGPAPAISAGLSVLLIVSGPDDVEAVTCVSTSADVLFSSSLSGIVLSGSTDAVLVIVPIVGGDVALIVIVAFEPWLTAPPMQVTVCATTPHVKRQIG